MVKADAKGMFLGIGYQPGKSATLVRNPNWSRRPTSGPPTSIRSTSTSVATPTSSTSGAARKHMVQNDTPAGGVVKLPTRSTTTSDRVVPAPRPLRVAQQPPRSVQQRQRSQGVLGGPGSPAMLKADGGELVAQLGTHFIYPGSACYDLAGGDPRSQRRLQNSPKGNPQVATKYMKLAGFRAQVHRRLHRQGRRSTGDPASKTAAIANAAAQSLGFKTTSRSSTSRMYEKYCGNPKALIDVCPNGGWIRDWATRRRSSTRRSPDTNNRPDEQLNLELPGYQDWPKSNGGPYTGGPLSPLDQLMRNAEKVTGDANRAQAWAQGRPGHDG